MHISVPVEDTMEIIEYTQISPLISKCKIKVCYIGQNRNNSFITKEVAMEMGRNLPGSPIVGFYNKESQDFEEHNRNVEIEGGEFSLVDVTKAYGFVGENAKVWFQKFIDDNKQEREYLVTEGYLWTEVYPESKRIIEQGNNQSMEIRSQGFWSEDINSKERLFIINEALIEKLCILGENFEPCFEGAQIKNDFSLKEEFAELKKSVFSMMNEIKELYKGGLKDSMDEEKEVEQQEEVFVKEEEKEEKTSEPEKKSGNSDEENSDKSEDNSEDDKKEEEEKKKYNLEEVQEYIELKEQYDSLQANYTTLENQLKDLQSEVAALRQFKLDKDKEAKQAMIDSFYMLSDEDKADVVTNIDSYSLDDIEAKLSILCVRNKVNFNLGTEEKEKEEQLTFNLDVQGITNADVPDWIKAVKQTEAKMQ